MMNRKLFLAPLLALALTGVACNSNDDDDTGTDPVVDPGTDPVVDPGTDPVVDNDLETVVFLYDPVEAEGEVDNRSFVVVDEEAGTITWISWNAEEMCYRADETQPYTDDGAGMFVTDIDPATEGSGILTITDAGMGDVTISVEGRLDVVTGVSDVDVATLERCEPAVVVDPGTDPVVDTGTDPVVDPGTDPVVVDPTALIDVQMNLLGADGTTMTTFTGQLPLAALTGTFDDGNFRFDELNFWVRQSVPALTFTDVFPGQEYDGDMNVVTSLYLVGEAPTAPQAVYASLPLARQQQIAVAGAVLLDVVAQ